MRSRDFFFSKASRMHIRSWPHGISVFFQRGDNPCDKKNAIVPWHGGILLVEAPPAQRISSG